MLLFIARALIIIINNFISVNPKENKERERERQTLKQQKKDRGNFIFQDHFGTFFGCFVCLDSK